MKRQVLISSGIALLTVHALMACAHQPQPLSTLASEKLTASPAGEKIYRGQVWPRGDAQAVFVYERHVSAQADLISATHVTRRTHDQEVLVWQRAWHHADYTLSSFEQVHAQTGVVSGVRVLEDGALEFHRGEGAQAPERSVERADDGLDAVVGPTLFGYVLTRWREATAPNGIVFRFAVPERLTSYEFSLRCGPERAGQVECMMEATSMFVRMGIDPIQLIFSVREGGARHPLRYRGPVPPRGDELSELTATVRYDELAAGGFR